MESDVGVGIVHIVYRNHRGETAVRVVRPLRMWFGATEWHPTPQWMLDVIDVERGVERSLAMRGIHIFDFPQLALNAGRVS